MNFNLQGCLYAYFSSPTHKSLFQNAPYSLFKKSKESTTSTVLSFKDSSFRFAPFGKTQLLGSFGTKAKTNGGSRQLTLYKQSTTNQIM